MHKERRLELHPQSPAEVIVVKQQLTSRRVEEYLAEKWSRHLAISENTTGTTRGELKSRDRITTPHSYAEVVRRVVGIQEDVGIECQGHPHQTVVSMIRQIPGNDVFPAVGELRVEERCVKMGVL